VTASRSIAVVGGGVIGCSVAYHLAARGLGAVALYERDRLGSGTTWHSAGNITWKPFGDNDAPVLYAFELTERIEAETGLATGWRRTGRLFLARTQDALDRFAEMADEAAARGVEGSAKLDPKAAAARHPLLDPDAIAGAWFNPLSGRLNPADYVAALARGAKRHGAAIREQAPVTEIAVEGGRVRGLTVGGEAVAADVVVVAGGLWSRPILAPLGVVLPQGACEHFYLIAQIAPPLGREAPSFVSPEDLVYGREEVGGLLFGCFDEAAKTIDPADLPDPFSFTLLDPDWDKVAPYFERAAELFPALAEAPIKSFVNGPETFSPDGHAVIGPAGGIDGLFVASAMNSHGVTHAAMAGHLIADLVAGAAPRFDAAPYAPDRFGRAPENAAWLADKISAAPSFGYVHANM